MELTFDENTEDWSIYINDALGLKAYEDFVSTYGDD